MRLSRNFVIPMTIVLFMCVMGVVFSKLPIVLVLIPLAGLIPALIVQSKNDNNFPLMLFAGLMGALLYIGFFMGLGFLATEYSWAEMIFYFPY